MRFLLRMTFWLGVILVLLPRSESQTASHAQVSASDAMSAATATVGDMRQFCDRQPEACMVGSQAAEVIEDRAKAGAKQLYDMFNERRAATERDTVATTATAPGTRAVPLPPVRPVPRITQTVPRNTTPPQATSPDTLTPADLDPAWRGPLPRKDPRERPV